MFTSRFISFCLVAGLSACATTKEAQLAPMAAQSSSQGSPTMASKPLPSSISLDAFDDENCAKTHSALVCSVLKSRSINQFDKVMANKYIYSTPNRFVTATDDKGWLKMRNPKTASLSLVHATENAFADFYWEEKNYSLEELDAKAKALSLKVSALEPDKLIISVEPFKSNGALYYLCFDSGNNTIGGCLYSAYVNIGIGSVIISAAAENVEAAINTLEGIIRSIDLSDEGECTFKDCVNGLGKMQWVSGEYYFGGFKDSLRHGQGTYVWQDQESYVGTFENNKRTGLGAFFRDDMSVKYAGQFKDNNYHGEGNYFYPNGAILSANFVDGAPEGIAELEWTDDNTIFRGQFKGWDRHGRGTYHNNDNTFSNDLYEDDNLIEVVKLDQAKPLYPIERPVLSKITEAEITKVFDNLALLQEKDDLVGAMDYYSNTVKISIDMNSTLIVQGQRSEENIQTTKNKYQHLMAGLELLPALISRDESYEIVLVEISERYAMVEMLTFEQAELVKNEVKINIDANSKVNVKLMREAGGIKIVDVNATITATSQSTHVDAREAL